MEKHIKINLVQQQIYYCLWALLTAMQCMKNKDGEELEKGIEESEFYVNFAANRIRDLFINGEKFHPELISDLRKKFDEVPIDLYKND